MVNVFRDIITSDHMKCDIEILVDHRLREKYLETIRYLIASRGSLLYIATKFDIDYQSLISISCQKEDCSIIPLKDLGDICEKLHAIPEHG